MDKAKYDTQNKNSLKHEKSLEIPHWAWNINPWMKKLNSKQPGTHQKVTSAMNLYTQRIITKLMFNPGVNINENINEIINYIACFPTFIKAITCKQDYSQVLAPFCVCIHVFLQNK